MLLKKILLASAVCCFGTAVCSTESNDEVKLGQKLSDFLRNAGIETDLSVDGKGNMTAAFINQNEKGDFENGTFSYEGDVNLHYRKRANDFGYGVECCVKTRSGMIKQGRAIVDSLYGFIETDNFGRFNIGYTATAADKFTIGGNSVFVAYGGPDSGNLHAFFNQSAGTIVGTGCHVDDWRAAKIAWFSPTIKGFSLAMSYTLDSKRAAPFKTKHCSENCNHDAHACWDYAHTSGFSRRIFTIAGKYEYGSENDFNATFSAGGWFGKGKSGTIGGGVHDVRAYQIGTILGYKAWKVAFGFIDCGRSIVDKYQATAESDPFDENAQYDIHDPKVGLRHGADAGKIYTYGISYKMDRLTLSAGYFRSVVNFSDKKSERAIANITTVGAEYKVNNVLSVYAEYDNIITKTCDRARAYAKACEQGHTGANRANMFIFGSKIYF